jgi:hypothetical protein
MMVPAFMVPDNRVFPFDYVEEPAVNEKKQEEKASSCDEASGSLRANRIRR